MKYKKTTIIGAALSLALVLGLTAGFASNPVEPGADGQGGIWSVSLESSWIMSWEYSADGSSLAGYSISWSQLEESLANQVTKGELTQEKADEILAWAREATRDEEGKRFRWTFDEDCGLIMENGEVFYVYQDGNGNRVKIDKETFVSSFIYPMANKEISVAVEGGETTPGADAWRMSLEEYKILLDRLVADGKMSREDADWLYAGAKQAVEQAEKDGRAVVIQTNESGGYAIMPAVRNEGVFVITDVDTNGNLVVTNEYGMVLPEGTTMEAYKAVLDRAVSEGNLTPEQAAKWLGEMEDAIEQVRRGEISRLMFNRTNSGPEFTAVVGSDPVEPAAQSHPLCTAELCTVSGPHWHENGEVIHFYYTQGDEPIGEPDLDYDPQVADSAGAGSEPIACPPEAIDKNVSNEACPVEGCTEIMAHQHDGRWYCFLHDVCPVEGCTVSGSHTIHCSGFHSGGVCDGSCASYSSTYPSASSGHHSESHHSSGHH